MYYTIECGPSSVENILNAESDSTFIQAISCGPSILLIFNREGSVPDYEVVSDDYTIPMATKKATICISLPKDMIADLNVLVKSSSLNRSALISQAIKALLKAQR